MVCVVLLDEDVEEDVDMRPIDADVMIKDLQAMQRQFDAISIDGMIRGIEK